MKASKKKEPVPVKITPLKKGSPKKKTPKKGIWLYMTVTNVYVVVNFLFQLIFIFPLFWGMVMYANEFKTKEKQKLSEIKN